MRPPRLGARREIPWWRGAVIYYIYPRSFRDSLRRDGWRHARKESDVNFELITNGGVSMTVQRARSLRGPQPTAVRKSDRAGEGMTPERPGRSESFRLTAINASIWSVKELELPDLTTEEASVAQLIVRDLSEDLVKALKQRAAKRNHSTEQEHREILQSVLRGPKRRHLADVLAAIPNVGEDSDFEREQTDKRG
jgi:plasmid stability protein